MTMPPKSERDESSLIANNKPRQAVPNEMPLSGGQLRYSPLAPLLFCSYRWRNLRRLCVAALLRREGGEFYSGTLRRILEKYHGVRVGAYSYGPCMVPGAFPAG